MLLCGGAKAPPEEHMMSQRSKRELFAEIQPRYLKAKKREKQRILDEFTASTGYHRKYAIRVLKHGYRSRSALHKSKGRTRVYRGEVVQALEQIWEIYGRICSKRLHPYLPEGIKVLERCGELRLSPETKALLLQISRSSIDRCLAPVRFNQPHGLSTTKPGTLLKKNIPIRTFADWDEDKPGFLEIDCVAHCGDNVSGQYLHTLTCTDLCTGWTETLALPRRSQEAVCHAINTVRQLLPFDLLGIDSDNGSEFINDLLYRYCQDTHITFTRSRPYQKNDQAHVEQKNWSVVRHLIGYDRLESEEQLGLLESVYQDWRLYINFFQPMLKLSSKEHIGNRILRKYDTARTPYQRVMEREEVSLTRKAHLLHRYLRLNPVELRHRIDDHVLQLWSTVSQPMP
jgi:integrase-like protein